MKVWRICRARHAVDPLSGKGGLHASGRWHTKGRRVTYTSESLALAALELLVHASPSELPADLVRVEIEMPDDLPRERLDVPSLVRSVGRSWRDTPGPESLQAIGNEWLDSMRSAVLQVPSAVIPTERNALLNPTHEDAHRIEVVSVEKFVLDPRLAR